MSKTSQKLKELFFFVSIFLIELVLLSYSPKICAQTTVDYAWKPLKIGGGGWVVGMYIHPTEPDLMYIRTDVSGAYRWDASSSEWKQIVTSYSLPSEYIENSTYDGVSSLVGAPADPDIAYMAFKNQIFKSTNRGDSWFSTSFSEKNVIMEANGAGRQEGERLAVDPVNSDIVYYGSIKNGLWVTQDSGDSWSVISEIPHGINGHGVNTVVFDKNSGVSDAKTNSIYVTVDGEGVFKSSDTGQSWKKISDTIANPRPRDAEIGPDGTYYITFSSENGAVGSVWKYSPDSIWTDITPSESYEYSDIAVDPTNGQRITVIKAGGGAWTSEDQGNTWITHESFHLVGQEVEWLGKQSNYWLSVGEILFDPFEPGKLWFAEGFGVWSTNDLADSQISWIEHSKGIEETVGNAVICPPGGKPITAMWDIGAFYHTDPDIYNAIRAFPDFLSCWSLDWCPADPDFIVGAFQTHLNYNNVPRSSYSTNGGKIWKNFKSLPDDLVYGNICVSANDKNNIVWLPANGQLPSYTTDGGAAWQKSVFNGVTSSGYTQYHSSVKPLCADRVDASTFYFYHSKGIFATTDGGATWEKVSNSPFSNRWNIMMKATPGKSKDVWLAEGRQSNAVGGLWHSVDGGVTWNAVPGLQEAYSFGFGKPKTPGGYPTIFAAGVADGQYGIYRSVDAGSTWEQIGIYPLGIFAKIDDIDGDKDVFGKVYICFASGGFAYGTDPNNTSINSHNLNHKNFSFVGGILTSTGINKKTRIRIYNLSGMLIYQDECNSDFSVDLNKYVSNSQVCLINLFDGYRNQTEKIVLR